MPLCRDNSRIRKRFLCLEAQLSMLTVSAAIDFFAVYVSANGFGLHVEPKCETIGILPAPPRAESLTRAVECCANMVLQRATATYQRNVSIGIVKRSVVVTIIILFSNADFSCNSL